MPLRVLFDKVMLRTRAATPGVKLAGTLAISTAFCGLRFLAEGVWPTGYPFLFGFVSVVLSAALFNEGMGFLAISMSMLFAMYFYMPPYHTLAVSSSANILALTAFGFTGIVTCLVIETLHHSLEKLRESERIRDLLLREFRHRTRNDLQSLVGIFSLQARNSPSPDVKVSLKLASEHAIALARIHNRLIDATPGDGQEAVIDSEKFIRDLCLDMHVCFSNGRPVLLNVASVSTKLNTERAVNVGLILNEILCRSLRYAYPEGRAGVVDVAFEMDETNFTLTITDQEVNCQVVPSSNFTLRLLKGLATQLRGTIVGIPQPVGSKIVLTFPLKSAKV